MIFRDHFQNYKRYTIPKAQLIIADIPYNLGNNAYASNPAWYKDGDNENGESALAGKSFLHPQFQALGLCVVRRFSYCRHFLPLFLQPRAPDY